MRHPLLYIGFLFALVSGGIAAAARLLGVSGVEMPAQTAGLLVAISAGLLVLLARLFFQPPK